MSQAVTARKPVTDGLTVVAIAAIAMSLNVAFHEGVHALTCVGVGSQLQEYSALYASCDSPAVWQRKMVSGSAPVFNLLAGVALWVLLRNSRKRSSEARFFIWLFMLMNWFYGAGYFILSGIADVGDWASVIDGWEPSWVWRTLLTLAGILLYPVFIRLGLQEFGKMVEGEAGGQHCQHLEGQVPGVPAAGAAELLKAGRAPPARTSAGIFDLPKGGASATDSFVAPQPLADQCRSVLSGKNPVSAPCAASANCSSGGPLDPPATPTREVIRSV